MFAKIRRTKIVVTLGPATDRENNLERIITAGANVVRLNFSHGNVKEHIQRAQQVRQIAKEKGINIALLGDLQGPKIRISTFKHGAICLTKGDTFILDTTLDNGLGTQEIVGVDYKQLPNDLIPGDILLLDDGRIRLQVENIQKYKIITKVLLGGSLSNNKGINKLGGGLSAKALTSKDKADILLAAKIGVDYLGISFPRTPEDLHYAKKLVNDAGSKAKIVAKIERAEIVAFDQCIDEIILASEAIMVARGDLGVEIGDASLVGIQKKLIRRARVLDRIVITATQMMESMINNPLPTRAEVMDVANAVLDGTDAVMLSAETATGNYPIETVKAMAEICIGAEKMPSVKVSRHRSDKCFSNIEETTAMSAMFAANHLRGVKAIVAMTESGRTALIMSRITSWLPIFALSRHQHTLNLVSLYRGVMPIYFNSDSKGFCATQDAIDTIKKQNLVSIGDIVIVTQGDIMCTIGCTNTCRIIQVT